MIEFRCSSCNRAFAVKDELAGRSAKCKSCGQMLTVPSPTRNPGQAARTAPPPMRIRRLIADAQQMKKSFSTCEFVRVHPREGDPPDTYRIEYQVAGLMR